MKMAMSECIIYEFHQMLIGRKSRRRTGAGEVWERRAKVVHFYFINLSVCCREHTKSCRIFGILKIK